ncbi:hypothetical protein BASA81_008899 [Batrachochytrium salamandrivorans]|nr:hypothetical protein BASA81_008899 [Batrachochytrium salamandrivorans]
MSSWEEIKAEGNDLLNKGDSIGAAEKYTQALALLEESANPSDAQILFSNRSAAELRSGKYAEALSDAERCIELGKDWAKAYNRQANALKALGRLDEALAACDYGLGLEPDNGPLVALHKAVLSAQVVDKLLGTWHGMVAEEVGGYMQVFEFVNDFEVIVRVLGTTVNARYELNVTAEPHPHLDINVPNSPGAAFVRHIYRFANDGNELELCSPYLRPPEERPTEFAGLGMVIMKRGEHVRSQEEEAFRVEMAKKTEEERVEEFLRQCISAVPELDVRPFESDSDAEIAKKLTANVKFQTFYQSCTDRIGSETEGEVKEIMIGNKKPTTQAISDLVIQFRNKMFAAGLIAGGDVPEQQQQVQVQEVEDAPPAAAAAATVAEPAKKKKDGKKKTAKKANEAETKPETPAAASVEASNNWLPVVAVLAAVGVVAAVAGAVWFRNQRD